MKSRRINLWKKLLFAAMFAASLFSGIGTAHASLGLDFNASTNPLINSNGGPGSFGAGGGYPVVGWSFTPTVDLSLNRLGLYDADIDRRHTELHYVGIWAADQSLITSVSISEDSNTPEISPTGAFFHFVNVGNIRLQAGQTYFVGATTYTGSDYDAFAWIDPQTNPQVPVVTNPYITYNGSAYAINTAGNQLVFPGLTEGSSTYTIGANIDVTPTPIPAAAWLLGSGLMGLVGIKRRTGK